MVTLGTDEIGPRTRCRPAAAALLVALAMLGAALPATATHGQDGTYDQPVLFEWTTTEIDILVAPPADPKTTSEQEVLKASTEVWREGVDALAADWLRDTLTIRVYAPPLDPVPPSGFDDPEILVTSAEPMAPYSGIAHPLDHYLGQSTAANICVASTTQYRYPGIGDIVVDPTELLDERPDESLFNVNAHEVGHCLGLGHPGTMHPQEDVMAYGGPADDTECPSSLNIRGLESVFASAAGQPGGGSNATVSTSSYEQIAC